MITQNRWQHILGVARKAKMLAEKLKTNDTQYAEDKYLLTMDPIPVTSHNGIKQINVLDWLLK